MEVKKRMNDYERKIDKQLADMTEMDVAFANIERLETIVRNIQKYIQAEQYKQAKDIFIKANSPIERFLPIFKKLDAKIRKINYGVSFRTTESGLVYEIKDQNFTAIYPQVNTLKVDYTTPEGWKSCKLIDDTEIDGAMILVKESYDFIREKKILNR